MKFLHVSCVSIVAFFLLASLETSMGAVLYKPDIVQIETCGTNEVYRSCGANPACEKTCDNVDVLESAGCFQTKNCVAGCVCEEGYVRDINRVCIWENRCPRVRH